jgi:Rhodopirellula transposase DDE domain
VPYGVYDVGANAGWVNVGTDAETCAFAVESIRRWWVKIGRSYYPEAATLLITADGGGSHGARLRLWKTRLSRVAQLRHRLIGGEEVLTMRVQSAS